MSSGAGVQSVAFVPSSNLNPYIWIELFPFINLLAITFLLPETELTVFQVIIYFLHSFVSVWVIAPSEAEVFAPKLLYPLWTQLG